MQRTQAAFGIGQGAVHDPGQVFLFQSLEYEHPHPGEQGAVDLERGIFGGGADKG